MDGALRVALAAAALAGIMAVGLDIAPRDGGGGGSSALASSPLVSPEPSLAGSRTTIMVAGTELTGPRHLTVDLPSGWEPRPWGARLDVTDADGTVFFVSLVDDTFADPCSHIPRSPKVESTVGAWVTALAEIPGTTATEPVQRTIAGREATYLEIIDPASLPCELDEFYLWQDSPDGDWWPVDFNEVIGVWILDVDGQAVAIAARSHPGTSEATKARLLAVLDSIGFEVPPDQPSVSPAVT